MIENRDFVIVDVETTGLSPARGDRMLEIAALRIKNGTPDGEFHSLINPQREISYEAYLVNGISQEMVDLICNRRFFFRSVRRMEL